MITLGYYSALARLQGDGDLNARITKVAFGTSGATESETDSAITGAYLKAVDSVALSPDSPRAIRYHWTLSPDEANGLHIQEVGLLTEDGVLVARKSRSSPIEKTSDMELGDWFEIQL